MLIEICELLGIKESEVINSYVFGSMVYGTQNDNSDTDVVVIVLDSVNIKSGEFTNGEYNVHCMTMDKFVSNLDRHEIVAIECYFSPVVLKHSVDIEFNIDKVLLRKSVSATVSNSWVKCRKKILQGDYYTGIKSFYHALRIVMFGIQLKNHGRIIDWKCANFIYLDLMSKAWEFDELKEKYQPMRNKLLSEFRLDIDIN